MNKNYYEILQIPSDASPEEIARAYDQLTQDYHPNHHTQSKELEELFKGIIEAYQVLSDPKQRQDYNAGLYGNIKYTNPDFKDPQSRQSGDEGTDALAMTIFIYAMFIAGLLIFALVAVFTTLPEPDKGPRVEEVNITHQQQSSDSPSPQKTYNF